MERAFDEVTRETLAKTYETAKLKWNTADAAVKSAYKRYRTLAGQRDTLRALVRQQERLPQLYDAFAAEVGGRINEMHLIKSKRTDALALHLILPEPAIVSTGKKRKELVVSKQHRPLVVITLPYITYNNIEIYDADRWEKDGKYVSYPHQTIDGGTPCWGTRGKESMGTRVHYAMQEVRVGAMLDLLVEYLHQGGRNHKHRGQSVSLANAKKRELYTHKRKEQKRGKKEKATKSERRKAVIVRRQERLRNERAAIPTLDDVIREIHSVSTAYTSTVPEATSYFGVSRAYFAPDDHGAASEAAVPEAGVGADALHCAEVREGGVQRVREAPDKALEVRPASDLRGEEPVDGATKEQ